MALTLLEASKIDDGDVKRQAIIQMFAENSDILRVLPFEDIQGGSLSYNVEGTLPGVAFRGFNEAYAESVGVINPATETLRIAGGDLDVDKALIKTRGEGVRSTHEAMKVKALSLHLAGKIINGDSATQPREFDGFRVRITGDQLMDHAGNQGAASTTNGALSLGALDKAIDNVDDPTHMVMSKAMRRKLTAAARTTTVGGDVTFVLNEFGKRVTMYNEIPILIADYDDLGARIIDFDEAGPAGGVVSTSVYIGSFGTGKLTGLQNGGMEVNDLGEIDSAPVLRTRIEWLVGMAVMHGRSLARVWGITDVAAVS